MKHLCVLFICALGVLGCLKHVPNTQQSTLLPPAVNRSYPLLGSYALLPRLTQDQADKLAVYYQLIIIGVENQDNNPGQLDRMRRIRPGVILVPYLSLGTFPDGQMNQNEGPNGPVHQLFRQLTTHMWLYTTNHELLSTWEGSHVMNLTTPPWRDLVVSVIANRTFATHPTWTSGVYFDEIFRAISWLSPIIDANEDGQADNPVTLDQAWAQGEINPMTRLRQAVPSVVIISQNGMRFPSVKLNLVNGVLFEDAINPVNDLDALIAKLQATSSCHAPRYSVLNVCGTQADKAMMRTGMALSCLFNIYYFYDFYGYPDRLHDHVVVYPDYRLDLGTPTAAPSTVSPKVWKRTFTKGLVAFNASAATATVTFVGQRWNADGQSFTNSISLASRQGVVLYNYHP